MRRWCVPDWTLPSVRRRLVRDVDPHRGLRRPRRASGGSRRSRETARTDLAQGLNVALLKPYAVLSVKRHLDGTAARAARAFRQASIDERRPAPIKDCTCQLELPEIPRVAAPCLTVRGATRAEMRAQKPLARVFGDCLCSQHDVASLGSGVCEDCLCSQHDAAGLGTATQDNSTVSIRAAWLHACSASMRRHRLVCRARCAAGKKLCQDDALKGAPSGIQLHLRHGSIT